MHTPDVSILICGIVLDYAKRIDPKVAHSEGFDDFDCVLVGFWEWSWEGGEV